jgi:hypothetical protein
VDYPSVLSVTLTQLTKSRIAIVFAFIVYGMAGKVIWSKRRHLDGFMNPLNENPFTNTVTTEIEITHEERFIVKDIEGTTQGIPSENSPDMDAYSVNIQVLPQPKHIPAALRMRTLTRDVAESETNPEAWLYARVAVLFFIALLVTWVPSSVNRVYALARPHYPINFPLNYVSSFVFPLQGFWNAIVYIITSQTACRRLWNQMFSSRNTRRTGSMGASLTGSHDRHRYPTSGKQRLESVSSLNCS